MKAEVTVKRVLEIIDEKEVLKWLKEDLILMDLINKKNIERAVSLTINYIKRKIKEEFK